MTKTCATCERPRPIEDFGLLSKSPDGRNSKCKPCKREYEKASYSKDGSERISKIRARTERYKTEMRAKLAEYLRSHPCVDCGESDMMVLEFDHIDGTKLFNVAEGRYLSWATIEAEIKKCEVRCANCHRRVTIQRAGSWRMFA